MNTIDELKKILEDAEAFRRGYTRDVEKRIAELESERDMLRAECDVQTKAILDLEEELAEAREKYQTSIGRKERHWSCCNCGSDEPNSYAYLLCAVCRSKFDEREEKYDSLRVKAQAVVDNAQIAHSIRGDETCDCVAARAYVWGLKNELKRGEESDERS